MQVPSRGIVVKIHLVISVIVVVPAAFIYGFDWGDFLILDFDSIDELNFSKAIMGLYLGFSVLWILGILNSNYLKAALISNIVFMIGLGFGRLLSMVIDGIPSTTYISGTIGELILGFYGMWVLNSKYLKKP